MGPYQMLPLQARGDLGVKAMKEYITFHKAPELLELRHQIVKCHIQDTRWSVCVGGSYSSTEMQSAYSTAGTAGLNITIYIYEEFGGNILIQLYNLICILTESNPC